MKSFWQVESDLASVGSGHPLRSLAGVLNLTGVALLAAFAGMVAWATPLPVRLDGSPQTEEQRALPLAFWRETASQPVPVALFVLRVDLRNPQIEVATFIADDPDGEGPAEAKLVDPLVLASRHGALAAVNANAFEALPDEDGQRPRGYYASMPVEIAGFAAVDGVRRSEAYRHGNNLAFWLCPEGRPQIGQVPGEKVAVRHAVNAWRGDLVAEGRVLPRTGGDRHPRTAIGYDADGRWLYLVVADGRQSGYSEGMTLHELATAMLRLGAARAINLDGGGSSVMLVANRERSLRVVNRPSSWIRRPVPVMIGVRPRLQAMAGGEK